MEEGFDKGGRSEYFIVSGGTNRDNVNECFLYDAFTDE